MDTAEEMAALKRQVELLTNRVGVLEDTHAIRTLHFKYGYYMDKCLFEEIVELFCDDAEIHFMGGVFRGRAGARRMYGGASGMRGPAQGMLFEHVLAQDIVDVAPDGRTAKGRFRCLMQGGVHETKKDAPPRIPAQFWEGGVYENQYVREDGVWKIRVFDYNVIWQAHYDEGWAHSGTQPLMVSPYTRTYPEDPRGPDELQAAPRRWPEQFIVPFHYPHPVTGRWLKVS
jgi:SnoaL-like domain